MVPPASIIVVAGGPHEGLGDRLGDVAGRVEHDELNLAARHRGRVSQRRAHAVFSGGAKGYAALVDQNGDVNRNEEAELADRSADRGMGAGLTLGGGLVIAGIVIAIFWSLIIGIIVALVGLVAFGGFARGALVLDARSARNRSTTRTTGRLRWERKYAT